MAIFGYDTISFRYPVNMSAFLVQIRKYYISNLERASKTDLIFTGDTHSKIKSNVRIHSFGCLKSDSTSSCSLISFSMYIFFLLKSKSISNSTIVMMMLMIARWNSITAIFFCFFDFLKLVAFNKS